MPHFWYHRIFIPLILCGRNLLDAKLHSKVLEERLAADHPLILLRHLLLLPPLPALLRLSAFQWTSPCHPQQYNSDWQMVHVWSPASILITQYLIFGHSSMHQGLELQEPTNFKPSIFHQNNLLTWPRRLNKPDLPIQLLSRSVSFVHKHTNIIDHETHSSLILFLHKLHAVLLLLSCFSFENLDVIKVVNRCYWIFSICIFWCGNKHGKSV